MQSIVNAVPRAENPEDLVGVTTELQIHACPEGWTMRDSDGKLWPIDHMLAETTISMKKTVSSARTHMYTGGGKNYAIATSNAQVGGLSGTLVMVRNEDDTTSVGMTFDKPGVALP